MKRAECAKLTQVLLVEDNAGDARLIQHHLLSIDVCAELHMVEDGVRAMAFLRKEPPYEDVPRPDLIFLDLNLPIKDGRQVLAEIKQDPALCRIPVIVLTSSSSEEDIGNSYDAHANAYITKPMMFEELHDIILAVHNFWVKAVKLPPPR